MQKLATEIKRKTTISDESFQALKSRLHSLIQQWTRPDVRSRPDQDIAEGVALLKVLHELHNTQDQWDKWFAKFFQAHSRKHNLRAALKQKGLV